METLYHFRNAMWTTVRPDCVPQLL